MKRVAIIILLLISCLTLTAPSGVTRLNIQAGEMLYAYNVSDSFLRAVIRYESNYNPLAVNPVSKARGLLQITPVMVREVNKYSDTRYTWNDAFDPMKSIEMWNIIMQAKNPEMYWDKAVQLWFGVGVQYNGMTWHRYYNEVTALIN